MVLVLASSVLLTVFFSVYYKKTGLGAALSASITFLTVSYHFLMRLAVGEAVTVIYKNREFKTENFFFKTRSFEPALYERLGVKRWKDKALTAKPEQFKVSKNAISVLLHNICQAQLVHAVIVILSFVPLFLIIPFGAPAVFIITSFFAAAVDAKYVIIQRYNLPRAKRLLKSLNSRKSVM